MKKTNCIQLVLITAALAGCERPQYQQAPYYSGPYDRGSSSQSPYYPMGGVAGGAAPGGVAGGAGTGGMAGGVVAGGEPMGGMADSTNACPLEQSQLPPDYYLWYQGLQPFDFYYGEPFRLFGYYAYRFPALVVRAGFGRVGLGRVGFGRHGGGGHS
jgi:hypothetical protein